MNLKRLLTTPFSRPVSKETLVLFFVVALLGFTDATYLTIEHYLNQIPPCAITGCETVLTSPYSVMAGIPVSLLGSIYYLIILVAMMVYFDTKKEVVLRGTLIFTVAGLLSSIYFTAIQAFVLNAYCQYCLLSALTSTLLFIIACVIFKKQA